MNKNLSPKALNELGDKYFHGLETPRNIELAFTYYKQAADAANPVGLFNVGRYFLEKKDYRSAIEYFQKALASGYTKAYLTLADMAMRGLGMRKSKKKAFRYTMDGANQGDTDAYNQLARYYEQAIGCKRDDKKTWEYYQKSADRENAEGMYRLGLLHLESSKGKKDPKQALVWLDKAAQAGHREAIRKARELYQKPHPAFRKRSQAALRELAFHYEELLAGTGDEAALVAVAEAYHEGTDIIRKNPEKAVRYFLMLVGLDNTVGHYGYGSCLAQGLGIATNYPEALKHLEIAANRGSEAAMSRLGEVYRLGLGVKADPETAKKWYYEAAKHNNKDALLNLALLHYRGEIMSASNELAYQYVESAVKKNNHLAHYWHGIFLEKGIGCEKDVALALKAFQRALHHNVIGGAYKYGSLLYEQALANKKKHQANKQFVEAREQLIAYAIHPQANQANAAFASFHLANIFKNGQGTPPSPRPMRYWLEVAAEYGYPKAMVELFRILKAREFNQALRYLHRAAEELNDPEALYELGLLHQEGFLSVVKNPAIAKKYFEQAAKLRYKPALDRLMMS
mgnify:FL=1